MEDDLNKLEKIFGKVTRSNSEYLVKVSAKIYPGKVKLFIPRHPYMKKIPFMEEQVDELDGLVEDWKTLVNLSNEVKEDSIERSLRRTKTLIADLTLCNEFDLFSTFTFSPEKSKRTDPLAVKLQMANWLRNQRNRNGAFPYLIVPEYHKDHKALHFHGLFKDYTGELTETGFKQKGRDIYHFKSYTLGFNSAVKIDDVAKVSNYVRKYITKDMPQFPGKRRFWASTGLKRPQIVDNPSHDAWYMRATPSWTSETEYGLIAIINNPSSATESQSLTEDSTAPSPQEPGA